MRRIVLLLMAVFLIGGMAMAQQARRGDKRPDPKVRAERMTERMAKEYSLNDTQKKQLLEANMALVEKMGDMPMHRRQDMKKGKKGGDSCTCPCKEGNEKCTKAPEMKNKKAPLTDEQRAQKKAEIEKKRKEMKAAHAEYDTQIKKIMTKDQYSAYTKKQQEKKEKIADKKKNAK